MAMAMICLASCSKKLDSLSPKDAIPLENLSDKDIALLRNGIYNKMEDAVFSFWFDFDKRGENFVSGPGFSLIDPINMSPESTDIGGMWRSTYTNLDKVNSFIETIDNLGAAASTTQLSYKGEALYFRALLYYNLVIRWGDVPILTKSTFEKVQRSPAVDVWKQIITDLTTAEPLVAPYTNSYYVSQPAVQALLAKVYLAQKNYDDAITYANKVIATGKFAQATDANGYAAMFVSASTSKELIFALANNTINNQHLFYQDVNDVDATWDFSPDPTLFTNLYADNTSGAVVRMNDKRKTAVFFSNNTRLTKFPNGKTGQQLVATASAISTPIVVSRYSEVLLILAEAQSLSPNSSIGAAAATLNPYFANRYSNPPAQAAVATLSATNFQNLILNERRREFFGEGQWWYDVKRTNRTDLFSTLGGRSYLLLYPIPQTERDLAGYTQNTGY